MAPGDCLGAVLADAAAALPCGRGDGVLRLQAWTERPAVAACALVEERRADVACSLQAQYEV